MMTMKKGERIQCSLAVLARKRLLDHGSRTDVISVVPAQMSTVEMVPDDPGIWLFHCHMSDHMEGGMVARYQVLP